MSNNAARTEANKSLEKLDRGGSITLAELMRSDIQIRYLYPTCPTIEMSLYPRFPLDLTKAGMKEFGEILGYRLDFVHLKGYKKMETKPVDYDKIIETMSVPVDEWCISPCPTLPEEAQERINRFMELWVFYGHSCTLFAP